MKKFHVICLVLLLAVALILIQSLGVVSGWTASASENAAQKAQTGETMLRARVSEDITVRATRRGGSAINLRDGHDLITDYTGSSGLEAAMRNNQGRPLALASGDFDEDGVPDLISGYACADCSNELSFLQDGTKGFARSAGLFTLHRGNVDALFPNTAEAEQRKAAGEFTNAPFLAPGIVFAAVIEPDFLGAGDFDADGHFDVVMAARGSDNLYWLAGDGRGGFGRPHKIALPGVVTSLVTGEINRADGLTDVVVGVASAEGSVLVFEGAEGALMHEPEQLRLPANATGLALGQLDDAFEMDLVVAAGSQLIVVHGRDRKLSLDVESREQVAPASIDQELMPFVITSIAVGDFTSDYRSEVALLSSDGVVHVLGRERKSQEWGRIVSEVATTNNDQALKVGNLAENAFAKPATAQPTLVRGRVSVSGKDDLVVVNRADHRVQVIATDATFRTKPDESLVSASPDLRIAASLDMEGEPVTVLPMRLAKHALSDLVILKSGVERSSLAVAVSAPVAIITVNSAENNNVRDSVITLSEAAALANGQLNKTALTPAEQTLVSGTPTNNSLDEIRFSGVTSIIGGNFSFSDAVTIDGTTAGRVEINGNNVANTGGINIAAANSVVRGMVINRYTLGTGIEIRKFITGGNCIVEGNRVGTDVAGNAIQMSSTTGQDGVRISDAPNSTIGGTTDAARNIISGNAAGIAGGNNSPGLKIQGNYVGVNSSGTQALGNRFTGVNLVASSTSTTNVTIGGTDAGARNIISGNGVAGGDGIRAGGTGFLIQRNLIGTDVSGSIALANQGRGVDLTGTNSTIGGTTVTARNIISGSRAGHGVVVNGNFDNNPDNNLIQGNYIGTNMSGTAALGNAATGVLIFTEANTNTVGGTVAGARNIISGNGGSGVTIQGGASFPASNNSVLNNYIGTDVNGTANLGNTNGGVAVGGGSNNRIGNVNAGNIIAFNGSSFGAVSMNVGTSDPFTGNQVRRNSIFGNSGRGIRYGVVNTLDKEPVLSMNGAAAQGRLLAARPNANYVVEFYSNPQCGDPNFVQAQTYIGEINTTTDASGNSAFFNVPAGLNVTAAATPDTGNTSQLSNCIAGSAPITKGKINLSSPQLNFEAREGGSNPPAQMITLTNTGTATLNWQAAVPNNSFFGISQISGTLAVSQSVQLAISASIGSLDLGTHQGKITFSAPNADDSPQDLNITLVLAGNDSIEITNVVANGQTAVSKVEWTDHLDLFWDVEYKLRSELVIGTINVQVLDFSGDQSNPAVLYSESVAVPKSNALDKRVFSARVNIPPTTQYHKFPFIVVVAKLLDGTGKRLAEDSHQMQPVNYGFVNEIKVNGERVYSSSLADRGKVTAAPDGKLNFILTYTYRLDTGPGKLFVRVSNYSSDLDNEFPLPLARPREDSTQTFSVDATNLRFDLPFYIKATLLDSQNEYVSGSELIRFQVYRDPNDYRFDGSRSMTLKYKSSAESFDFSSTPLFGSLTQIGSTNFFNFAGVFDPRTVAANYSQNADPNPGQGAGCVTPPANMVSWWPGDGNANDIQGTNVGTLQGGATASAAGKVAQAFSFNGTTGYVAIGNPASLKISGPLSIDAWINPSAMPASGNLAAIVTKWAQDFSTSSTSDSYGLWVVNRSGTLKLFSALHKATGAEPTLEAGTIPLNTWSHVAMTFDPTSGQYSIYLNGAQVGTTVTTGALLATERSVAIGREESFLTRYFTGMIDEVEIFNRSLSQAEIQSIFNADTFGKCKPGAPTPTPTPSPSPSPSPSPTPSPSPGDFIDLVAPGGSSGNSFITDTVDGVSKTVLRFPTNNGLALSPTTGVIPNNVYSIITLLKFDEANKRRRILDFKNGASDNGLYAEADNNLRFATVASGAGGPMTANTYIQVAITRDAAGLVTGFVNGAQQFQFNDSGNLAVIDGNNTLRFFQDNTSGGGTGEASAGMVARNRFYGSVLSAAEIAGLDREPSGVKFSAANYSVNEGAGSATITVTRTGFTGLPASVGYTTSDESAKQALDYTATSGTLSFAAGETSKTFQVPIINNQIVDLDRQLTLFLQSPNGVALEAQSAALLTISDNETGPPTWQGVTLTTSEVEIKTWTTGGRTYAYLKLLYPNAGYRVTDFGQVVKSGNDFTANATVEKYTGPSVQAVTSTAGIYDLGTLTSGSYNFTWKNTGTTVKTQPFTVAAPPFPANPIDDARQFVKQQYRDFLNREADQAGEDFWTDNITKCADPARRPAGQTIEQCTLRQRETTSGAFFLSPEFQYTGYYVLRMYRGALERQPKLSEFLPDTQFVGNGIVVGGALSASQINQNKTAFAAQFVNCTDPAKNRCSEFKAIYDSLDNQQYVDRLFFNTGVNASASERTALVNGLNGGTETRASVLQKVVDGVVVAGEGNQQFTTSYGQAFYNSEFTRAFVQLEYFGYMKRDPDEAGYEFWLGKLNQFGGDFVAAEMVLAFISSPEYRARFGQP